MTAQEVAVPETRAQAVARRVRGQMGEKQVAGAALAAALNMSQAAFSRRRVGELSFSLEEIATIAAYLDVSEEYLLVGHDLTEDVRHQGLEPRTRWFRAPSTSSGQGTGTVLPFRAPETLRRAG